MNRVVNGIGVALLASYWMGPAIAHIFVTFGFRGQDYVAVSAETRTERGEGYSSFHGKTLETHSCTNRGTDIHAKYDT